MSITKALTTAAATGLTSLTLILGAAGTASAATPGHLAASPGVLMGSSDPQVQAAIDPAHWHGKSRDYQRGFQQGFRTAFGDGFKGTAGRPAGSTVATPTEPAAGPTTTAGSPMAARAGC